MKNKNIAILAILSLLAGLAPSFLVQNQSLQAQILNQTIEELTTPTQVAQLPEFPPVVTPTIPTVPSTPPSLSEGLNPSAGETGEAVDSTASELQNYAFSTYNGFSKDVPPGILKNLEEEFGTYNDIKIGEAVEVLLVDLEDAFLKEDLFQPLQIDASLLIGNESEVRPSIKIFMDESRALDVGVHYLIHGGTAEPGKDFIPQLGTAVIKAGKTQEQFQFRLLNDSIRESSESIYITFFDPLNLILPETKTFEFTLQDDDTVGLSITPTCLDINNGTGLYQVALTNKPSFPVEVTFIPTNMLSMDVSSITISPSSWNVPQELTIEALEGSIFDLIRTNDVLLISDSADLNFDGETVLSLDIFYSDESQSDEKGLVNIDRCREPEPNPPVCDPNLQRCNPEPPKTCDPNVVNCNPTTCRAGDPGCQPQPPFSCNPDVENCEPATCTADTPGCEPLPPPIEDPGYCLELLDERPLNFLDLDEAYPNELAYIDVLRRTRETTGNEFVISGYANPEVTSNSDLSTTNEDEVFSFVGPRSNILRLELAKILLLSHCFPILDATTLDQTKDGREMANWDDLPRIHSGNAVTDELTDIAYSAMYYGLWEGYRDNTIRIGNQISTAEGIKLFIRIGEIVNYGKAVTFDNPSDQWWQHFYNKAKNEGTVHRLRDVMIVRETVERGVGIQALVKGMLIRNMYKGNHKFRVMDHLIDNMIGDTELNDRTVEVNPQWLFDANLVRLRKPVTFTIEDSGSLPESVSEDLASSTPSYLQTRERRAIGEYLEQKVLDTPGVAPNKEVTVNIDGTISVE